MISWINKYKPTKISDIVCNRGASQKIIKWLKNYDKYSKIARRNISTTKKKYKKRGRTTKSKWNSEPENRSCMLIVGNHGVGKTVMAELIIKALNYDIHTIDFNILVGSSAVKEYINNIMKCSNVINMIKNEKRKIVIIIDEIESITSTTKKNFITSLQKNNDIYWNCPIIFISNDQHSRILKGLKKNTYTVKLWPPYDMDMRKILIKIMAKEKLNIESDNVIDIIIEHSQSDITRLINVLYDIHNTFDTSLITENKIKEYIYTSKKKDVNVTLYEIAAKLLYNYEGIDDSIRYYEMNKTLVPLMVHQHYVENILTNHDPSTHFEKIKKIAHSLSNGDVVDNFAYSTQSWDMQEVHGDYTCVNPSYIMSNGLRHPFKRIYIEFTKDLNKTSIKYINKKNISNTNKCFHNMDTMDYIHMRKIIKKFLEKGEMRKCIKWLKNKNYGNYNIKIEIIDSLLKIDKTRPKKKKDKKDISPKDRRALIECIEKLKKPSI